MIRHKEAKSRFDEEKTVLDRVVDQLQQQLTKYNYFTNKQKKTKYN